MRGLLPGLQILDCRPLTPLRDRLRVDPEFPAQRRERSLRSLYCCSDGVRGRGAPMTYLSHTASFHSNERIAPSNRGIKHLVSLAGYWVRRLTSFRGLSLSAKAKWGRGYLLFVGTLTVIYLCLLLYVGLYQFPRAAQLAGEQRHSWFKQQMHSKCADCPEWGEKKVRGIAIASDGKQTLIATLTGVKSLNQEGLNQTWPAKSITKDKKTLPSQREK